MTDLNDVLTVREAAERYGVTDAAIKHILQGVKSRGKFYPPRLTSKECRKAYGVWLISKKALDKLFNKQ